MKHILANLLHLFVIFMMVSFVIGGILAAMGTFDHWTERYRLKRRRRRLIRDKNKNTKSGNQINNVPYYSTKPDKKSVIYAGNV
ncbi:hypothetical protein EWM62_17145 [Mucilaginibacter terrigena]|uniref:LapA family protein n=1 Tax=Mucilaginibacter terrigena TaxID=2492395 RepID=A0A4Q5LHM8_9SPHI|nr:hypothetical protein [Mucilaginibacter terrigena]RYU86878.1 hypothetical protein EWM62_17145 [Mucilaginibacter terrigena]